MKWTPEYERYHSQVVEACVSRMGEQVRDFFDNNCTFFEEFAESAEPEDVAESQEWYART